MLGIPNDVVDATEHLLAAGRPLGAARGRPRRASTAAASRSRPAWGSTRASSSASTATRALKARFGAWFYFARRRSRRSCARYVVNPPRLAVEVDGARRVEGVSAFVQNAEPYTYFNAPPGRRSSRARSSTPATSPASCSTARGPLDVPTVTFRALSRRGADRRATAASTAFGGVRRGCACARSTSRPVPLQVDGDYIGDEIEARSRVLPGALRVVGLSAGACRGERALRRAALRHDAGRRRTPRRSLRSAARWSA